MIERLILAGVLLAAGVIAYRLFARRQVKQAAQTALSDPILAGLKSGVPAIVYFTTPHCIPCKTQQQPALQRLLAEVGDEGVQIIQIDATQDPAAADRWGVMTAPTTFILDDAHQPRQVNHGVADVVKLKRQLQATRAA